MIDAARFDQPHLLRTVLIVAKHAHSVAWLIVLDKVMLESYAVSMRRITVTLPDELSAVLDEHCSKYYVSASDVLREALSRHLKKDRFHRNVLSDGWQELKQPWMYKQSGQDAPALVQAAIDKALLKSVADADEDTDLKRIVDDARLDKTVYTDEIDNV